MYNAVGASQAALNAQLQQEFCICDEDHESLDMHRCQCFKHRFCSDKCVGTYGFKTFGEFLTAPCSDHSGLSEIVRNAS